MRNTKNNNIFTGLLFFYNNLKKTVAKQEFLILQMDDHDYWFLNNLHRDLDIVCTYIERNEFGIL